MEAQNDYFPPCFEGMFAAAPYKVFRGGRGGARSWSVARALLLIGLDKPIRVLCARETQKSIRESVHKLLVDQIARMGLTSDYHVQHRAITGYREWPGVKGKPSRTEFIFTGISDQTAAGIKSYEDVDYCWVEEAQTMTANSRQILLPTLFRSNPGCEVWVTFNPELDTDPTWEFFVKDPPDGTLQFVSNWRDNPWFPEELNKLRLHDERTLPRHEYEWIWEGKCKPAVSGAIYAEELSRMQDEGRIGDYPHDPRSMVYPVFDLGFNNSMSVGLWQRAGTRMTCIEALHAEGLSLADWSRELKSRPYNWGTMFLPHDGNSGNRQTAQTDAQLFQALGWTVHVLERTNNENDAIRQTRLMFPTLFINKPKCERLVESLKRYRRTIPPKTQEATKPAKDKWSHDADMVRYANEAGPYMTNHSMLQLPSLDSKYPKQFRQV